MLKDKVIKWIPLELTSLKTDKSWDLEKMELVILAYLLIAIFLMSLVLIHQGNQIAELKELFKTL